MYIIGASGHGKVIAEIAEDNQIAIEAFVDADINKKKLMGYEIIHENPPELAVVIIAIGNNQVRKRIAEENPQFNYPLLQHPKAQISKSAHIDEGTVVMAGVSINADVTIGKHCIINTNASVDHDCTLADYVHLSPNVALAGNVSIGEASHIGIGACVIQGIKIGANCIVGAGTVIIRDIPDGATVVGNPGKIIKI
jgi:sugar O-acyltransferase (sialic acid O-acetyltransferase NeuD family)